MFGYFKTLLMITMELLSRLSSHGALSPPHVTAIWSTFTGALENKHLQHHYVNNVALSRQKARLSATWRMEEGGGRFTDSHTEMLSSSRAEIRTNANDSADPSLLRVRVSDTVEHHRGWKCTKEGGQILSMLRRHHTEAEANWMTVINHIVSPIMFPPPFLLITTLFGKNPALSTCYFVSRDKWWRKC